MSRQDLLRLRGLLAAQSQADADRDHLLDLQEEMDRATIVESDALPADVVALESAVVVHDVDSGAHEYYMLVAPLDADVAEGRISVLAPLGTALIGYRVGDIVDWRVPRGIRRLRIDAVQQAARPRVRRRLAA